MREYFNFYRSFYESLSQLGDKARLELYDAIMQLSFFDIKIDAKTNQNRNELETKLEQLCSEIETKLEQKRNVFAQFLLIKPYLIKSAKGYIAKLSANNGILKNDIDLANNNKIIKYRNNKIIKYRNIENNIHQGSEVCDDCDENFKNKTMVKTDPFTNPLIDECFDIYSKNCGNLIKLGFEPRNKQIREDLNDFLQEIDNDIGYFTELCHRADKLRIICERKIDFKMLIKNHIGIFNGKYSSQSIQNGNDTTISDAIAKAVAKRQKEKEEREKLKNGFD